MILNQENSKIEEENYYINKNKTIILHNDSLKILTQNAVSNIIDPATIYSA